MFKPSSIPRVFGLPCGVRFAVGLRDGILARTAELSPEAIARIEIFVSSTRMRRDLLSAFDDVPAIFLPKVRLITELATHEGAANVPEGISGLRRRLELTQLVGKFLEQKPDFAAQSSTYDLADSLAGLLAEMHDENVSPADLDLINVDDSSGHWAQAREFISLISRFFDPAAHQPPMPEARLRMIVDELSVTWTNAPPSHPIIVAGSTGSRGTTSAIMQLVANLPQGAVVLPGVDFDMASETWLKIEESGAVEHPQARFSKFASDAGIQPQDIEYWHENLNTNKIRNQLISLALRPAPVTDQWMIEGPNFQGLSEACADLTLMEAPDARMEAVSIALALRKAVEDNKTAALITPDRALARHVTSVLDRWNITPDDSAGVPLNQTPPGRLLRHVASAMGTQISSEQMLVLLKHPLVSQGANEGDAGDRGYHLLNTRSLEQYLRRKNVAFPCREDLVLWAEWAMKRDDADSDKLLWASWVAQVSGHLLACQTMHLSEHIETILRICEALVCGKNSTDASELWAQSAGREAQRIMEELSREAEYGGVMTPLEFSDIFRAVIGKGLSRDPSPKHSSVMIWGTLEARAQGADIVILGGLNETVWPAAPAPDPWFSRDMRKQAGLLSPEQQVGLSAHDFQQAVGAKSVILSRAKRNAEAETVGARWMTRLTNLLAGMSDEGAQCLVEMRARGDEFISLARRLEKPNERVPFAKRPSPRPPLAARPRQLSVTRIETLIRDPYQIYASRILRLSKMNALTRLPDPRDRGMAYHKVMEEFVSQGKNETHDEAVSRLIATAERVLDETVLWPAARRVWLGRIKKIAHKLVEREAERRLLGTPVAAEVKGGAHFEDIDFSLTCEADRIDETVGGDYIIYDYKTGAPPTKKQTVTLKMQLHLEAVVLEHGRFDNIPAGRVHEIAYLGLDGKVSATCIPLLPGDTAKIEEKLKELIKNYDQAEQGYTSRRVMQTVSFAGDFDHLARVGEWAESDEPVPEDVF
jgi:ATP-dependent helicase/nuclease subunit B